MPICVYFLGKVEPFSGQHGFGGVGFKLHFGIGIGIGIGKISVVQSGTAWEVKVVNDLHGLLYATPALSKGVILTRTDNWFYCHGG